MNSKSLPRSFVKSQKRGVALILTLSILAMILVLVVSFATLSRTEGQSAGNYRDYVASRYLAQAALNRAMADVAIRFVTNASSAENGISTLYSTISTNYTTVGTLSNVVQYSSLNAIQQSMATEIEMLTKSKLTGLVYPVRGADDIVDFVVLPGTSPAQAQWIGIKDTNGVYIGRIAYILTSGGLNINAIGNVQAHLDGGGEINARNEGVDASELNLVGALMGTDPTWTYDNAKIDTQFIVDYRNGANLQPGGGADDNNNAGSALTDKIDNDGDGEIDEAGEGTNDPAEHLAWANGSEYDKISGPSVVPDDAAITDLKELHNTVIGNDLPSRTRFSSKFANIQRVFTPQSSSELDPTAVGLSNAVATSDFMAIYDKLKSIPSFATNTDLEVGQCAANILSYARPTPYVALPGSPIGWANTNVGVARTPYINQVNFQFITQVKAFVSAGVTNTKLWVDYKPEVEFWYPYTNAYSAAGFNAKIFHNFGHKRTAVFPPTSSGMNPAPVASTETASIPAGASIGGTPSIANITDASHIFKHSFTQRGLIGGGITAGGSGFNNGYPPNSHYCITNLSFSVVAAEDAGLSKIIDFSPVHSTNLMGICSMIIHTNDLAAAADWSLANGNASVTFSSVISFALNDPRVKNWGVEYAGTNFTLPSPCHSLGTTNFSTTKPFNTYVSGIQPSVPLFDPALGEDKDYTKAGFIKGIAPKTFFSKGAPFVSVGELGRVHRGQPWRTIELKAGGIDGGVLDAFTIAAPYVVGTPNKPSYVHGAVNINARPSDIPTWAALFAGMPFSSEKYREANGGKHIYFDIAGGKIDPTLAECKELGRLIGARAGAFTSLSALTSVSELSNLSTNGNKVFKASPFNDMRTDEDKEWIVQHISNLITTRGSGNVFTVWAWGQTLRGAPPRKNGVGQVTGLARETANLQRYVAGETLLVASVSPQITVTGANTNLQMKINYYRYNPDMELSQ